MSGGIQVIIVGEINSVSGADAFLERRRKIDEGNIFVSAEIAEEIILGETVRLDFCRPDLHVVIEAAKVDGPLQFLLA